MNYIDQQFNNFIEEVCLKLNHPISLLKSPSRKDSNVVIRHCIFYVAKQKFGYTCTSLAKMFNRDHSTIVYSWKRMSKKIKNNSLTHFELKCLYIIETILNKDKDFPNAEKTVKQKDLAPTVSTENKNKSKYMDLLTVKEVASIFKCTSHCVREMIKKKAINAIKLPGAKRIRIPASELKEYLITT